MKMKRFLVLGLIACLMLSGVFTLSACGKEEEPAPAPAPAADEDTTADDADDSDDEDEEEAPDLMDMRDADIEEEAALPDTLEGALPSLREAGYSKTADGYKATDNVDGVRSIRIISAKGNKVKADLTYDYGQDNEEMIRFYKSDSDDAVSIMVSTFLTVLADRSTATDGTLEYVIHVGGQKVKSGKMKLSEAREYQEMAVDE